MAEQTRFFRLLAFYPPDNSSAKFIVKQAIEQVNQLNRRINSPNRLDLRSTEDLLPDSKSVQQLIEEQLKPARCHILLSLFQQGWSPEYGVVQKIHEKRALSEIYFPRIMIYRLRSPVTVDGLSEERVRQYQKVLSFLQECLPDGRHPAYIVSLTQEELLERLTLDLFNRVQEFDRRLKTIEEHDSAEQANGQAILSRGEYRLPGLILGPTRKRYALLVGVNHFIDVGIPDLRYCTNDAIGLKNLLDQHGYTTACLHDKAVESRKPTRANILGKLQSILTAAECDDQIWLHFSCHGKLQDGNPYLIIRDTLRSTITETGIALKSLVSMVSSGKSRRLIITLDACHTGLDMSRDLSDPEFIRYTYELAEGIAIISASTAHR